MRPRIVGEPNSQPIGFEISTSARDDGTIEAVYIYFSHRPVASTREIKRDVLLADFDAEGNIIGLEVLAPVKVSEIVMLADPNRRVSFERFVKGAAPAALIQA